MLSIASPKLQRPASARSPRVDAKIGLSSDLENGSNSARLILVTESEVSRLLQVSLARLRKMESRKARPTFHQDRFHGLISISGSPTMALLTADRRRWNSCGRLDEDDI